MKKFIILSGFMLFAVLFQTGEARANYGSFCQPTDFTADHYLVDRGNGTVLHWDSIGCDNASIVPADYPGDRPPFGSVSTGAIFQTTTYTLTVYDAFGNIGGQRFLTVQVRNTGGGGGDPHDDCSIDSFTASDYSILDGDSTELEWRTTGCDDVKITPELGSVNQDGSEDVSPNSTTTYTIRGYVFGNVKDTATVRIIVDEDEDDDCSIDSFTADDYSIQDGDSVRISWRTTGARDIDLSPGFGNRADDGSVTVNPSRTTTYRLEVRCDGGGSQSRSLTVNVDDDEKAPQAITTVANVLGSHSAQLNGIAVPNTNSGTTSAWFEWGRTTSLGYSTNAQTINSNNNSNYYNATISGLSANSDYYYRAVVSNRNGTAYGDIVRFQTRTVSTVTPPPVIRTEVVRNVVVAQSAPSLLELRVDSTSGTMCVNGVIDYTVTYRNISSQTLQNAVLQISHQKDVTFISSSRGDYDPIDQMVMVSLGNIAPNETGTVSVRAKVNEAAVRGNLTVMTATVVYTNPATRAQENAIAYSLVTITNDCPNVLAASTVGFGSFLPDTLLEWLLLILIILALVVLARQLYRRREVRVTTVTP